LGEQVIVTPTIATGKRKRGQKSALSESQQEDELDELERIDEEHLSSAQRSTLPKPKAEVTESPAHDDAPDELEAADENHLLSSSSKTGRERSRPTEATPVPPRANGPSTEKRRTPLAEINSDKRIMSRKSTSAKASAPSTVDDAPPVTPVTRPLKRPKKDRPASAPKNLPKPSKKPTLAIGGDVEDELSPDKLDVHSVSATQSKSARVGRPHRRVVESEEVEEDEEADELSPAVQKSQGKDSKSTGRKADAIEISPELEEARPGRRAIVDRDREAEEQDDEVLDELDELSPEIGKSKSRSKRSEPQVVSSDEQSEEYEEHEETEDAPEETIEAAANSKHTKKPPKASTFSDKSLKPAKKRPRRTGPNYPIEVLRLKMAKDMEQPEWLRYVKGVNPAEVLNQFFKEMLDAEVSRIRVAVSEIENPERRRHKRGKVGLARVFQATLADLFLDLSSASNNYSVLTRRIKNAKKEKILMRKEYMEIHEMQNKLLLQMDELREDYHQNIEARAARNTLNESIFDIQAAIEGGREKASAQGREDEGPEIPLRMLMQNVAQDVGSDNGGLLADVQELNGLLEKAAGILEGRA
jgi:hypothetical protein